MTLADIPFVRLRSLLPGTSFEEAESFAATVQAAQAGVGPPKLRLIVEAGVLEAGGNQVPLAPAEFAFYWWLTERRRQGLPPLECPSDGAPEHGHAAGYLRYYRRLSGRGSGIGERTEAALRKGMDKAFFLERKSRIRRRLNDTLGAAGRPYHIDAQGKRPHTRYGLSLTPEQIEIVETGAD